MSRNFIAELEPGSRVDAPFALSGKEMRAARTGEAYLSLEFTDRTGAIPGIMFRPRSEAEAVPVGVVVHVRGTLTEYRGIRRISVESMRPAVDYDLRDIVPASMRDERELVGELRSLVRQVSHPGLRALLRAVFGDVGFMARFKASPATRREHHAYLGGLLEHTVAVARACDRLAESYPQIDADVLLTGALLHDIGVTDEIHIGPGMEETDEGRLLGHEVLGDRRLMRAAGSLQESLPAGVSLRLSHMLLSHHAAMPGIPGPSTIEAVALSQADRADAETARYLDISARASLAGEAWTDASNTFGRRLAAPGLPVAGEPPREGSARAALSA
jgi:3'-5' exoribonuclease